MLESTTRQGVKDFADKYLIPYMKVEIDCSGDANNNRCTSVDRKTIIGKIDTWNSKTRTDVVTFKTKDNMLFSLFTTTPVHIVIAVDINGDKAPNTIGKDIFWVGVFFQNNNNHYYRKGSSGVYLWGSGNTREYLMRTSQDACKKEDTIGIEGGSCAAVILLDGWKISKEYPW